MKSKLSNKNDGSLILHVITGLGDGGAEGVLYRLCLHDKSFTHVVVSLSNEGKYGERLKRIGVPVYCLHMKPKRIGLLLWFKLIKIIRNYNPDIVQTWMYHADFVGGVCSKIAGVKKVFWGVRSSSLQTGESKFFTIVIARILAILSWILPDMIILCARSAADFHKSIGYNQSKFAIIENGYDLTQLYPDPKSRNLCRKELDVDDAKPLLGMVARYDSQKDHANLLAALHQLKVREFQFSCVLVGKNIDWKNVELVDTINRFGLSEDLILLGQVDNIAKLMNVLDIHVLSSAFGEGFPNVIAEAMACGVPCVATNVGESAEIIGVTGWVVEPRNPTALAESIITALAKLSSSSWQNRQTQARQRVQTHFEISKMVYRFHRAWNLNKS